MPPTYDPGPPPVWESLFANAPLQFHVERPKHFRTEFGPVFYRGRLDGSARLLVVAQDPSTDEILAHRTLIGSAGQLVQGLLKKLGLDRSYLMLNTFIYGIKGQFTSTIRNLSASDPILTYRNSLFDQAKADNTFDAVIAFGNGAHHCIDLWPGGQGLTVFKLRHPTAPEGVAANWNAQLPALLAAVAPDAGMSQDAAPYGSDMTLQDTAPIPRHDLPFGVPAWHGTGGGTRSKRSGPTVITWTALTGTE